ncbi:MAG: PD-(D/E)XK nuclease family protein [Bacteroidetes bacterium]|nr:PD-(D/E)XK nuclease family protein [Bacteroidota bacterium]
MKRFLTQATETIIEKHGTEMSRVLVLMPNQRSCTYFNKELQSLAQQAILSPMVSTLQHFILEQSPYQVCDRIALITELYACHKNIGGELLLDEFIGIADILIQDFDELDEMMVHSKLFFKNLNDLQSMKTYEPGEVPGDYQLRYRKFWSDFGLLYEALRKRLKEKKQAYQGMALREVAEHPAQYFNTIPKDYEYVYLIGFSGLSKTDEAVIRYLKSVSSTTILADADKYYVQDEAMEAGFYFRKFKSLFSLSSQQLSDNISTRPMHIEVIGTAKNIGQVKVAGDILQNRISKEYYVPSDTVVVIPDEKLLGSMVAHIPAEYADLNVTMGVNIHGSSPASWIEMLFRLQTMAHKFSTANKSPRFYYKDVFDLLLHPYFRLVYGQLPTQQFVARMKKSNRVVISAPEICKGISDRLQSVFSFYEDAKSYADFLEHHLQTILQLLIQQHRSGNTARDADAEIVFRVMEILRNTASILNAQEPLQVSSFIALLRESFQAEKVPLEGEPVKGLQLMGIQETRSLNFKNVIVLSANEGILSSGKQSKSYIPHELRKEFLTTHRERDAVTAYLFYRLFHQAENVYLLYNTEPDELGGGEKSRFILQLMHELPAKNAAVTITDKIFAIDPPETLPTCEVQFEKTDAVLNHLKELFKNSGISPSAINTYINCSLQYYLRYVAGLREEEDMEENLEASTIGSAVHFVLEEIFKQTIGKPITADFLRKQATDKPNLEALLRKHLSERFDIDSLNTGKNLLLFRVCTKLTIDFLLAQATQVDWLRETDVHLKLLSLEEKLTRTIQVNGTEVKVRGTADRIEVVNDVIQIVDYKTTTVKKIKPLNEQAWEQLFTHPDFSKPLQLLLYAWMYSPSENAGNRKIRSGIYWLRNNQLQLDTLRDEAGNDVLSNEVLHRLETALTKLLEDILNPEIPFSKTDEVKRCQWCDFKNICNR